jgi:hypothetical protein
MVRKDTPMGFAARMDELGKPAWIALLVLTFVIAWPIGLALLAYLIWSGRMGCGSHGRWYGRQEKMERWRENWRRGWGGSSGNAAFDDRLRKAKDKAEFDQFMADRRNKPQGPTIDGEQPA